MPMAEALRRAPHAIVVPPRRDRYEEASEEAFAIFRRYTPLVEPLSLDEAFLDVTASQSLFGDGEAIARAIKRDVRAELALTASAGVAPCKFVAKVASDLRKPDGLVVVPRRARRAAFLAPLPIERMWGVGPKTAPKMRALGFATLGDLARADEATLERALGSWGTEVGAPGARRGRPRRRPGRAGEVDRRRGDVRGGPRRARTAIAPTLLEHAGRVARRLVRAGLCGAHGDREGQVRRLHAPHAPRHAARAGAGHGRDPPRRDGVCSARVPLEGRRVRLTGVSVSGSWRGRRRRRSSPTSTPRSAAASRSSRRASPTASATSTR